MRLAIGFALAALAFAASTSAAAAEPAKPLFASDDVIRITIRGPVDIIAKAPEESRASYPGELMVSGTSDALPIQLSQRGITRRKGDVCQFPPLRVTFNQPPPAGSLFAGQRRLKLVTHCRASEGFQQYVLMEYATYRLYNQLTPMSIRARLAKIDYVDAGGKPITSRVGFFSRGYRRCRTAQRDARSEDGNANPGDQPERGGFRAGRNIPIYDRQPRLGDAGGTAGRQLLPQQPVDRSGASGPGPRAV